MAICSNCNHKTDTIKLRGKDLCAACVKQIINSVYAERNNVATLAVKLALEAGYKAGVFLSDERYYLMIEIENKRVYWMVPERLTKGLPFLNHKWDGTYHSLSGKFVSWARGIRVRNQLTSVCARLSCLVKSEYGLMLAIKPMDGKMVMEFDNSDNTCIVGDSLQDIFLKLSKAED